MKIKPRHLDSEHDKKLLKKLHQLVSAKVQQLPSSRLRNLRIKVFILPLFYFGLYVLAITQTDSIGLFYLLYALMGLMVVIIFCELIHELAHKNIFKKPRHNSWALLLFDLLGANSYIWQQRHLRLHHQFPNVNGWDADVEQKGPIAIYPNEAHRSFKRYQHRYVFFLYPFFMINWLLLRDFRDFFSRNRIIRKTIEIPQIEYFKLFFFKSLYFFMIVGIPVVYGGVSILQALGGLLTLTISGSLLAMIVLLTPHVNSGNAFPLPDAAGKIETSWFRHQLITTNDIENSNWFIRNMMGNFNYHVAHHLFPKISSVYAPEVTQVLKSFSLEHDLPYKSYPLSISFKKHYELIRKNAISFKTTAKKPLSLENE